MGCQPGEAPPSAKSEKPAKLEAPPLETNLLVVHLTPQAEQRLGITTAPVEMQAISRRRMFGGIVMAPPGRSIIVSAPVAGTLAAPEDAEIPLPGEAVDAGQPVFKFLPLLSPERFVPSPAERVQMANAKASLATSQLTADGDVKRGRAEVEAAQIAVERAQQLLDDRAGSRKALEEAVAAKTVAQKTLEAAQLRKTMLDKLTLESESGDVSPMEIAAPEPGILNSLSAARGQTVTAGAALFEIVNLKTVWIRVPVYVGELEQLDLDAEASVTNLDSQDRSSRTATPVSAPPSADALSSTADLYYELNNSRGSLRPGERLSVSVPLRGQAESAVVPAASLLHDVDGGTWVYVQTGEHEFRRQRVSLRFLQDGLAVLAEAPDVGTKVVVDGAAELFGTEFGAGK